MGKIATIAAIFFLFSSVAYPEDHKAGKERIEKDGYEGPKTCERCHPGVAREFLTTVHWTHASKAENVENVDKNAIHGMRNRNYTMCNGNDIVNNLKEIEKGPENRKQKFSGCNSCHPGDHIHDVGSTGIEAESAIDCLVCHSSAYDYSRRKPYKDEKGRVILGQDRSKEAAMAIGKPGIKNCMVCHEAAGGGVFAKRGFFFTPATDVHAEKGLTCVSCHKAKDHRIPTGFDPNNWAHDGLRLACEDCHAKPHKDEVLNKHFAKLACQTCHIISSGGAFAKDFTKWSQDSSGYYEPTTVKREPGELVPVYAWYNKTVKNEPSFIGPNGSRTDGKSRIYPFKLFIGKGFFDKNTGNLLTMDFAPPMNNGDVLAGVASAARITGVKNYKPEAGWQTLYFGANHLVAPKGKSLTCERCHAENGVLRFSELGYSEAEIKKLTSPEIYFSHLAVKQKEDW